MDSRKQRLSREYVSCASFIFETARSLDIGSAWMVLKGFPIKAGHPGKVGTDIKADGKVGDAVKHLKNLFVFHKIILSGRYPSPKGGYTT